MSESLLVFLAIAVVIVLAVVYLLRHEHDESPPPTPPLGGGSVDFSRTHADPNDHTLRHLRDDDAA